MHGGGAGMQAQATGTGTHRPTALPHTAPCLAHCTLTAHRTSPHCTTLYHTVQCCSQSWPVTLPSEFIFCYTVTFFNLMGNVCWHEILYVFRSTTVTVMQQWSVGAARSIGCNGIERATVLKQTRKIYPGWSQTGHRMGDTMDYFLFTQQNKASNEW